MIVEVFANDEAGYRHWMQSHPQGFVLVSWNPPRPEYISVHRADCHCINPQKATHKIHWTQSYIKVCATSQEKLHDWVDTKWGSGVAFIHTCGHCRKAGRI